MRFLDHVEGIGSETVSKKVAALRLPPDPWRAEPCDDNPCAVDRLHERWHQKYAHEDQTPLGQE